MLSNRYFRWLRGQNLFSIRSYLTLLVLIGMIPLLLFSTAMVIRLSWADRETFERGANARGLALVTAMDAELKASITTLQALATSDDLDTQRLAEFRKDAERFLKSHPDWLNISLAQPSGQQVLNLRLPAAAELGTIGERSSFDHLVRTLHPVVGNLKDPSITQQIDFAVRVPVVRGGVLKYILSAVVTPRAISDLLARQNLPADWTGVVVDGNRRLVARTLASAENLGRFASESFRAALARAPEGWFRDTTIDGREVYISYNRSPLSGWTVAIGVPIAVVDATFHRSLFYTILFGVAFLGAGIALAWTLSTRSAGSVQALATMARNLGSGKESAATSAAEAKTVPTRIVEIETLREAFLNAARLIQDRANERDRVEASLRRVSERLELAQEAANIGSFERDLQTDAVEWSASMEKLFGLPRGGFGGTYADFRKLVHPDDIVGIERAMQNSIATSSPFEVEYRVMRSDGAASWMASRGRIISDNGSRRIIGVNIDITARKRAEEELRQLIAERQAAEHALREADRRKDEFLAMLGHELRNPLNVVSTSLELLRSQDAGEAVSAELHEMITAQISHMARLVDDLLDVSRITHGNIRLELKPCDFTALARDTLEEHRGLLDKSGLSLTADLPEGPLWVLGDRTRLKQVIGNGLQNANKFAERGGNVAVSLTKAEGENTAVLSIRDTGIGMDEEILQHAFEPFSQAETGTRRSRGGLGLGLAVVKGLIDLHHGTVALHSAGIGKGSQLMIRLPLTERAPAEPEIETPFERMSRSYRILLIEDNLMGSRAMRLLLSRLGHEVQVAHTGREGIEAARRFDPQVVLCDIGLPDVDGFAVARALREDPVAAGVYLIALSGYGQAEYQRKALEAGFNIHITKPVHIDDLTELLKCADVPQAVKV